MQLNLSSFALNSKLNLKLFELCSDVLGDCLSTTSGIKNGSFNNWKTDKDMNK